MKHLEWNDVFSALPDAAFFEIVRHYLGPMSTPFHKPDLVSKLAKFLEREDVIRQSITFIDEEDATLLSCITLASSATEDNLNDIIPNSHLLTLQERLFNLEERLLITRTQTCNNPSFSLTPLGEIIRESGLIGPGVILGAPIGTIEENIRPWFNDNILNSALSFLIESQPLFRKEGAWRKKTLQLLKQRFPVLFHDQHGEKRLLIAGRGLINAGLASLKDDRLEVNLTAWRVLENMAWKERRLIMIAIIASEERIPPHGLIDAIQIFTECLPVRKAYSMKRMANILQIIAGGHSSLSPKIAQRILSHLVLLGELAHGENGGIGRPELHPFTNHFPLSITPTGDITCHPNLPLFCDLALSAEPINTSIVTTYHLNKDYFIKGLIVGSHTASLIRGIEQYSNYSIPGNIAIQLSEWEAEFRTVSLRYAVVLKVEGYRQKLLEETRVLDPFTIDKLDKGVWLLDFKKRDSWQQALTDIGITQLPEIQGLSKHLLSSMTRELESVEEEYPYIDQIIHTRPVSFDMNWNAPHFSQPSATLNEFSRHPAIQQLSEEEKTVFTERLKRRLILVPEQIRPGIWRYGPMTAKGLDYHGKVHLAKTAIAGRNERLELTIADKNDIKTIIIIPQYLKKRHSNHILVGISLPDEQVKEYMIQKIGLLKRIKMSLF